MSKTPHFHDLVASRRALLGGLAGLPLVHLAGCATARAPTTRGLTFASVAATKADTVTAPPGYSWRTLIAWGDALYDNMAPFDPDALTRADQEMRFGANNDMLALFAADYAFPPPTQANRMLLCANNEYITPELTFPGVAQPRDFTRSQVEAMLASIGVTVVEIENVGEGWRVRRDPAPGRGRARRITPFTPVLFTGPAAAHPWIVEAGAIVNAAEPDPSNGAAPAEAVRCGTLANCAGGTTPWGTYLSAEENIQHYSYGAAEPRDAAHAQDARSFGYPARRVDVSIIPPAFRAAENPYGPALYGWIVEIDPYDPGSTPKKRTALGRKMNECATTALTADGRVAVYMGDDQANQHVYKFVTRGRFDAADRAANMDLLDHGQLYCARFEADGSGRWLAITLAAANAAAEAQNVPHRFADEGDLMVRVRVAAGLLGATPMDRPEDIEAVCDGAWRGVGPVLISCTNNSRPEGEFPANPRREEAEAGAPNYVGHMVRLDEADGDCGAVSFTWEIFAMGGDPDAEAPMAQTRSGGMAHVSTVIAGVQTTSGDRFANPDNLFIDSNHRVWVATDGNDNIFTDCNDCVLAAPINAEGPRPMKRFLVGPVGAEICGPLMAPDERAFFCSIQHPGGDDAEGRSYAQWRWETGAQPGSTFPDGGWPRSAVIVITRDDGGRIGD